MAALLPPNKYCGACAVEAIEQFREAIAASGIKPPESIIADGRIHRFSTNGHRKDAAGWYVFHLDGIAAGAYGCWRNNINETWCSVLERTMTAEERAEYQEFYRNAQREREAEQRKI